MKTPTWWNVLYCRYNGRKYNQTNHALMHNCMYWELELDYKMVSPPCGWCIFLFQSWEFIWYFYLFVCVLHGQLVEYAILLTYWAFFVLRRLMLSFPCNYFGVKWINWIIISGKERCRPSWDIQPCIFCYCSMASCLQWQRNCSCLQPEGWFRTIGSWQSA